MASIQTRKAPDGKVTFRAQVRKKGFPPQTATFQRKTDARRWAQSTESAINEGRFFRTTEGRKRTVSEMLNKYLTEELPHKTPKVQKGLKNHLAWWNPHLDAYVLADVTPTLIADARMRYDDIPARVSRSRDVKSYSSHPRGKRSLDGFLLPPRQ